MAGKHNSFGRLLRDRRVEKGFSLRKFAELVGVSPTCLSQIEQGNCDPPTVERVQKKAVVLGENADELTALAGRVPVDLPAIIQRHPALIAEFLREAGGLSPDEIQALTRHAWELKSTTSVIEG